MEADEQSSKRFEHHGFDDDFANDIWIYFIRRDDGKSETIPSKREDVEEKTKVTELCRVV